MNTRSIITDRTTSTAHRLREHSGECSNIHGHNLHWEVEARVQMDKTLNDHNMVVDLKDISREINTVDHALVLNEEDSLLKGTDRAFLGNVVTVKGDPTCEKLVEWMGKRIYELADEIYLVHVDLSETDSYTVAASIGPDD